MTNEEQKDLLDEHEFEIMVAQTNVTRKLVYYWRDLETSDTGKTKWARQRAARTDCINHFKLTPQTAEEYYG